MHRVGAVADTGAGERGAGCCVGRRSVASARRRQRVVADVALQRGSPRGGSTADQVAAAKAVRRRDSRCVHIRRWQAEVDESGLYSREHWCANGGARLSATELSCSPNPKTPKAWVCAAVHTWPTQLPKMARVGRTEVVVPSTSPSSIRRLARRRESRSTAVGGRPLPRVRVLARPSVRAYGGPHS